MKHNPLYTSIVWIPVNSEYDLPAESGEYLVINKTGSWITTSNYKAEEKAFSIAVSYWAYIPTSLDALRDLLWTEYKTENNL